MPGKGNRGSETSYTRDPLDAGIRKLARDMSSFFGLEELTKGIQAVEDKLRGNPTTEQLKTAKENERAEIISKLVKQMYDVDLAPDDSSVVAAANNYTKAVNKASEARSKYEQEKNEAKAHSANLRSKSFAATKSLTDKMEARATKAAKNDWQAAEQAVTDRDTEYQEANKAYNKSVNDYNARVAKTQQAINELASINYDDDKVAETKTNKGVLDRYELQV